MKIVYLSGPMPLTKTIERSRDGSIKKGGYPLTWEFSSEEIEVKTIEGFHKELLTRAVHPSKPCLLKGTIGRPLVHESRKGTTNTNARTGWVCLDLDRAPFSHPDEFMKAVGLGDISYVVQYSSSYKLNPKDKTLSCHIFCLLSAPIAAPQLKAWLMNLNFEVPALAAGIELSKSTYALHWPLDVTTCQNDKLLYIAAPTFVGMVDPLKADDRIKLVKRELPTIPNERLALKSMETLKKTQRDRLNALRTAPGVDLPALRVKVKQQGEYEVQTGVGEASSYEEQDCGDYVRLNLNGGDSWAYWYARANKELLHNFKGEPSVPLKEVLPHYYAQLVVQAPTPMAVQQSATKGTTLLAFRDKVTAEYWKGTWEPEHNKLELYAVKTRDQLDDFLKQHGRQLGVYVPEWEQMFDPAQDFVVDEDKLLINRFLPSKFMTRGKDNKKRPWPTIQRIIESAVGTGAVYDYFLNWIACLYQHRKKLGTCWVFHGAMEGTGKGSLINKVLRPLIGHDYVEVKRASELKDRFNGYLERALLVFIDEIDTDMFENSNAVDSELRSLITEPTLSVRRMRTNSYTVPNFCNFVFSSNKPSPVRIPKNDRRFNVGMKGLERLIFTKEELPDGTNLREAEIEGFAHFLAHYKANLELARTPLAHDDRAAMQTLSVTSVDELANDILTGDLNKLWDSMPDARLREDMNVVDMLSMAYTQMMYRFAKEDHSRISRDELAIIFEHCVGVKPQGTHKTTAFLRHHGIHLSRARVEGDRSPCIDVTWNISVADKRALLASIPGTKPKMIRSVK